jgi:hypothetical protein
MFTNHMKTSSGSSMSNWFRRIPWLVIPVLLFSLTIANAQQLTGTLSGITADQTDARVPGARVVVTNTASGDTRETKSDSQGFFSVTALVPGTYKVTISAKSFASWEMNEIVINQGDSRTIPNIHLKIGSEATAVTVISGADAEVPVDNAEISATLNNELVDSATLTGRNASELIKMMPGVTFSGATSSYNSQVTGTNNGPAGSFSANGTQPYGSTDVYLDGANLIDPGNAGTQVANINQDMTDSVKYLSASYGAEYAKGPAVLQAFSKSGGQKFHGEGYLYARNTGIGYANDWYNKNQQISNGKPNSLTDQKFYYIGGNVGGPVFFPHFNHNRDKLFFWAGYEYMNQHPYNSPKQFNVATTSKAPTTQGVPGQREGDFRNIGVPAGVLGAYAPAYTLPCSNAGAWDEGCSDKTISPWAVAGQDFHDLSSFFDPNGVALETLDPLPNQVPSQGNGWTNYHFAPNTPQNRWEVTGKVNYSFNDNNKLWGSYTLQKETDAHPLSIWWTPDWTIPYPAEPIGKETAHVYLANFTHVFSATTTNEVVFAYSEFVNNNSLSNAKNAQRSAIGFPTQSIFGAAPSDQQIPNITGGWNSGLSEIREFDFNSGIYGKGTFGKTSKAPSIADTFTKIIKSHSVKAGFYWDAQENLQASGGDLAGGTAQGGYDFENWGYTTTQNVVLDKLMGRPEAYNQSNHDPVPDILWHQWSLWAQDSWKASRKLTLNIGLRADHIGQWYDKIGGTQVWDPASYDNSAAPPPNTGLLWNKLNSKIPTSGFKSKLFLYDPRVGFAYDVMGTGKTVVRAGFGTYRYQVSGNDASGAMNGPLGTFTYGTGNEGVNGFYGYGVQDGVICMHPAAGGLAYNCSGPLAVTKQLNVPQGVNQNHADVRADKQGDDKVPFANTYSFGVAQALPGHTVMEVSYVGSASRNQWLNGGNGRIQDANTVPFGAFFTPDPKTGTYWNTSPESQNCVDPCKGANTNDWRPLNNYGHVFIQTHGGYANYNSLQVSAQKQSGNLYVFTNFTFGKVLGTRDGSTSNGNGNGPVANPFNLDDNYGPLGYDHTKVFNLSFSYKLPKPIHNNWALGQLINGWQISNYTTYQDGAPYQTTSVNMNAQYYNNGTEITMPMPATATGGNTTKSNPSTTIWYGTNQYQNGIQPLIVCDPRKGLLKNQYFNPNCFAAPLPPTASSVGQLGQSIWPYIRTPHYFGSDMAIFKAFRVTDAQRIEVRISATNWLNHPNAQFGLAGNTDNQLTFTGISSAQSLIHNGNSSTTGIPQNKTGYRWMQFAAKYYF